jgi:hypothetical protein
MIPDEIAKLISHLGGVIYDLTHRRKSKAGP